MIAACPECRTQYRVDPERLSEEGVRLRCTRCQTVFRVRAPQAAAETFAPPATPARTPAKPPAPAEPGESVSWNERLVLVATPDSDNAKQWMEALRGWGLEAESAHDGVEAILKIHRLWPSAVVLDPQLPKMFGFQVCEVIKRNEYLRRIAVVLIGAIHHPDRYRRAPSELYGADAYAEDPDMPEALAPILRDLGIPIGPATAPASAPPMPASVPEAPAPAPDAPTIPPPVPPEATLPPRTPAALSPEPVGPSAASAPPPVPAEEITLPPPELTIPPVAAAPVAASAPATPEPAPVAVPEPVAAPAPPALGSPEYDVVDPDAAPSAPPAPVAAAPAATVEPPMPAAPVEAAPVAAPEVLAVSEPVSAPQPAVVADVAVAQPVPVAEPEPAVQPAPEPAPAVQPAPEPAPAVQPAPVAEPTPVPSVDPEIEQAERLARIIISDVVLYNEDKFRAACEAGNVMAALESDLAEGRAHFASRVPEHVRNARDFLADELMRLARSRGMA